MIFQLILPDLDSGLKWIQLNIKVTIQESMFWHSCLVCASSLGNFFYFLSIYTSVVSKYVWSFGLFLSGKGYRSREHSSGAIKKMFFS